MTIEVKLSKREFRDFTVFDLLHRKKQWRGPALFAGILGLSAAVCFSMAESQQGAMLLGNVLLTIGLGLPCIYFAAFFSSLGRQSRQLGLKQPKKVYTVSLNDRDRGITADNGREQVSYAWKEAHHAYRSHKAIYLYIAPQRALILPNACMDEPDRVWQKITRHLPAEKCTVL